MLPHLVHCSPPTPPGTHRFNLIGKIPPDQKGCTAYGSGAAPTHTNTTAASVRRPLPTPCHRPHIHQFRMQFPDGHTQQHPRNRRISTFRFQKLKNPQGNCMRNFGDTPRPHAYRYESCRDPYRKRFTTAGRCTSWAALHQLGSITPPRNWCNTQLNGVTPLRNKPHRGKRPATHRQ